MKTTIEKILDPEIYGHNLIRPILWTGRHISQIFTEPLAKGISFPIAEVIARIITFVALVIPFLSLLPFTGPAALLGCTIKCFAKPEPEVTHKTLSTSSSSLASTAFSSAQGSSASSSSQAFSFVPFTSEILEAAKRKGLELSALYNGLKDLSGFNAQKLFIGITEFQFLYEKHRNPDPFIVDSMTKVLNNMDEIVANTLGMQIAQKHWVDFYQVSANAQGVIPQPQDGNCWLHTSILGLQHINHPRLGIDTHSMLRPKLVEWMQIHYEIDPDLKRFITGAIDTHKVFETSRLQEEMGSLTEAIAANLLSPEQIEQATATLKGYGKSIEDLERFSLADYFNHMKKTGSHGSHAELYAVSRMFQVNVTIWREVSACENQASRLTNELDEQIRHPLALAKDTINAVITKKGNHFNYRLPQSSVDP
jgi:hypothetical protein